MKPLDDELRNLFKRKEPPDGFADRVLAGLGAAQPRLTIGQRIAALLRQPAIRWVAVGAVACVVAVLSVAHYQHQQRIRTQADRASREAILALRITNAELEAALQRAQQATMQVLKVPQNQNEKGSDL